MSGESTTGGLWMRVIILILLTLFLGLLVFLKVEMNEAKQASNVVEKEYFTQEYIITKIDDAGYYGKAENDERIFFKKEHVPAGSVLKVNDPVVIYFEKDERIDGVVKVETRK
jgi:lipopolysaccharide export system protein LptC